jgi:PIN domain nuclease of toxin-antitoxin system
MLRQGPEFPAQVTSVEELIQQLNAELINVRLHALNESLRAACADTDKDHPSQVVFDALKYQLMQIINHIHAATTVQDINRGFDDLHEEFVAKYLQSYIAFSLSEIKNNEALKKKLIKLTGIESIDELTSELLYASLTEYKRNLFDKIFEVYRLLAQQCLIVRQACVSEDGFNDQMADIVGTFHRDVSGITSKIKPYKRSLIRIVNYEPTSFDLLEDRLNVIDNELQVNAYFEQVRREVAADADSFNIAVNKLSQTQSDLYKRAENLRRMFDGILKLSTEAEVSSEVIRKNIAAYDVLNKQLQDDVAEQQKQFSKAKDELLKKGKAEYHSFQELDVDDIDLPAINNQSIIQQQLIVDIDELIAELQEMQSDDSQFKEKLDAQTIENNTLFSDVQPAIEKRLMQARASYLDCELALQEPVKKLANACLGQTYAGWKNPLWVTAANCVTTQLSSINYSQHHKSLVAVDTRALIEMAEVSAANAKEKLANRFIESTTAELNRIHREYDTAIEDLQQLRRDAVEKIGLHLGDKARAELPTMKQEAIQKYELSFDLLRQLKPVSTAELNTPNSDALRKKYVERNKQKQRRASFSSARVQVGMDEQPRAVEAQPQSEEQPGFFKRHPWIKVALIGFGVGLMIAGVVIGVAAITVATMGAGAPPAIAGAFAVGAIVGAKLGLVAGSAAATGVGFAVVVGSAGAAGAVAGCATKAVVDRCQKPDDQQNVVAAPVVNPVQHRVNAASVVNPNRASQIDLPSASVVASRRSEKALSRALSHSLSDIQYKRSSHVLPRANVSQIGLFAFNALPMPEQVLIERFEIALAKEIYQIFWGDIYAAKFQARVTNKISAADVIAENLAGENSRGVVIRAIRNTIASTAEFNNEFGNLGEFTGNTMEDLDAYLHRAYQSQHALAI